MTLSSDELGTRNSQTTIHLSQLSSNGSSDFGTVFLNNAGNVTINHSGGQVPKTIEFKWYISYNAGQRQPGAHGESIWSPDKVRGVWIIDGDLPNATQAQFLPGGGYIMVTQTGITAVRVVGVTNTTFTLKIDRAIAAYVLWKTNY